MTLFTCQNEDIWGREGNFKACGQYLSQFPEGCVSSIGPATSATWWPHNGPDNAKSIKWDKLSQDYFKALTDNCPHPWMRGTAPLQQLTLRQGIDKNGKAWTDHHFADNAENTYNMSMILTNLVIWQQFLCNVRELAIAFNRLPPVGPSALWQEGRGVRPNPFLPGPFARNMLRRRKQQKRPEYGSLSMRSYPSFAAFLVYR